MKRLPNWNISRESAQHLNSLLDKAVVLGIDAEAVPSAGLPAWRVLSALRKAAESKEGAARDRILDRAQDALRAVDPQRHATAFER